VCLFSCDVDAQFSQQRFGGHSDGPNMVVSHFCKPVVVHPVHMVSPCSSPDSGPFYDILNLANVADVFIADSISQSIASDAP